MSSFLLQRFGSESFNEALKRYEKEGYKSRYGVVAVYIPQGSDKEEDTPAKKHGEILEDMLYITMMYKDESKLKQFKNKLKSLFKFKGD